MSQSVWGNAGPVLTHGEVAYDPKSGYELTQIYRGFPEDVVALGNSLIALGYQVQTQTTNGPWWSLHFKTPNQDLSDYIDRWEFNVSFKQQELFLNSAILQLLSTAGFSTEGIADLKPKLENYLESMQPNSNIAAAFSLALGGAAGIAAGLVYQMMQMGQTAIEVSQPTISRKRTYSYNFTGTLMSTQMTQDVWQTAALIAQFGLPPQVYDQITADPSLNPIANYGYGWKMRKNNLVIIPASNKIEEQIEWEWDLWTQIGYNYIA